MSKDKVTLQLTNDEALVLFELVSRFTEEGDLNIADQAETRVLWDLCSLLEKQLPAILHKVLTF